jgi:hypothetical protein
MSGVGIEAVGSLYVKMSTTQVSATHPSPGR